MRYNPYAPGPNAALFNLRVGLCAISLFEYTGRKMNKAELIDAVSKKLRLTKSQSEGFLDATLDIIQKTVSKGEEVKLVGFGTFTRQNKKARIGRNPRTGEQVEIPGMKVPRFKPGKDFRSQTK